MSYTIYGLILFIRIKIVNTVLTSMASGSGRDEGEGRGVGGRSGWYSRAQLLP